MCIYSSSKELRNHLLRRAAQRMGHAFWRPFPLPPAQLQAPGGKVYDLKGVSYYSVKGWYSD